MKVDVRLIVLYFFTIAGSIIKFIMISEKKCIIRNIIYGLLYGLMANLIITLFLLAAIHLLN